MDSPAELALIAEVASSPGDDAAKLIYADWLEERGDERAGFLRAWHHLQQKRYSDVDFAAAQARLHQMRQRFDAGWIASLEYPSQPIRLTAESFKAKVLAPRLPVIVEFWAPWSVACRQMNEVTGRIARRFEGWLLVGRVNVDEEETLARDWHTSSVPHVLVFSAGGIEHRYVGFVTMDRISADIERLAEQIISIFEPPSPSPGT